MIGAKNNLKGGLAIQNEIEEIVKLVLCVAGIGYMVSVAKGLLHYMKSIGLEKDFKIVQQWIEAGIRILDSADPKFEQLIIDFTLDQMRHSRLFKQLSTKEAKQLIAGILKEIIKN